MKKEEYLKQLVKEKDVKVSQILKEHWAEFKKTNKHMCANVDFYSGFVYDMLNIPTDLYTPIFAVARVVGLCAHIIEERINGGRIIRPAYQYVRERSKYVPLHMRK